MIDETAAPGWWVYEGGGQPHDGIDNLPDPPPWRDFGADGSGDTSIRRHIGRFIDSMARPDRETIDLVNAAIYLRRPLLVSGQPGTGKSTLAYSIAHELNLGSVLHWPITSRSSLADGLYQYDAIGRLQEARIDQADSGPRRADVGSFVRLGPLGTALLDRTRPRVVLIDELDKSDVDLPNDLLNVFEEGTFVIPELERVPDDGDGASVYTADPGVQAVVRHGRVQCNAFPIVVMTSNQERDFPPAFVRRCVRLHLRPPDTKQLEAMVAAHFGRVPNPMIDQIVEFSLLQNDGKERAIDQLLNQVFLVATGQVAPTDPQWNFLAKLATPLGDDPQ